MVEDQKSNRFSKEKTMLMETSVMPQASFDYYMYEGVRRAGQPLRQFARAASASLLENPLAAVRFVGGGLDAHGRARLTHTDPGFKLTETRVKGRSVAVTEEILLSYPFGDLIHFKKDIRAVAEPRVLLVPPMSGHFPSLIRRTVESNLPNNDVSVVNWKNPRDIALSEGDFGVEDYIQYLMTFIRHLGRGVHVIVVCQPCPLLLAAIALMSAAGEEALPSSITLIAGPVDTRINPTAVCEFAKRHDLGWFMNSLSYVPYPLAGVGRLVLPGFRQVGGFIAMNAEDHAVSHRKQFENQVRGDKEPAEKHAAFYKDFRAVSDLPGQFFLETIDAIFLRHSLPRGELMSGDQLVDLGAITSVPTLVIEGGKDDITGPGQTAAALELLTGLKQGQKALHVESGVGHYGAFNGKRYRKSIAPRIAKFIRAHDHD